MYWEKRNLDLPSFFKTVVKVNLDPKVSHVFLQKGMYLWKISLQKGVFKNSQNEHG